MLPQEKGTLDIDHSVSKPIEIFNRNHPQKFVRIKIDISTDSFFYNEEKHRKMIDEITEVIRKYI